MQFLPSSSTTTFMENSFLFLAASLSLIILIPLFFSFFTNNNKLSSNLPPSPLFRLPLIGHLHLIKLPLAQSLHTLSLRHGPIFSLRFGSRLVIVISSAATVESCFTQENDSILANRPHFLLGKHVGYNNSTLVSIPYGDTWRKLRRICSAELFSSSTLARFASARACIMKNLVRRVAEESKAGEVVLRPLLKEMVIDVLMKMVFGKGFDSMGKGNEFVEMVNEVLKEADAANPVEFVPMLQWVDLGGYQKRIKKLGKKVDRVLQGLVDEKRREMGRGIKEEDSSMIHRLLEMQRVVPEFYSDVMIKGLMIVIFSAGRDTTSLAIEWAMSLLLNHPKIFCKLKEEIDSHVGQLCLVNESDLSRLPYLQQVIWETLRLYPPTPVLIPHYSSKDCTIFGFTVPHDTMLFINAWAIHRDQVQWEDPLTFKPERFEEGVVGSRVDSSKFLPFGIGRRACPGAGLANQIICLGLTTLVQCFDWDRVGGVEIDMQEGDGVTLPKKIPLVALCKAKHVVTSCVSL